MGRIDGARGMDLARGPDFADPWLHILLGMSGTVMPARITIQAGSRNSRVEFA